MATTSHIRVRPVWWLLALAVCPWIGLYVLAQVFRPPDGGPDGDWSFVLLFAAVASAALVLIPCWTYHAVKSGRWPLILALCLINGAIIIRSADSWHESSPGRDPGKIFLVLFTACFMLVASAIVIAIAYGLRALKPHWRNFFDGLESRKQPTTEVEPSGRPNR